MPQQIWCLDLGSGPLIPGLLNSQELSLVQVEFFGSQNFLNSVLLLATVVLGKSWTENRFAYLDIQIPE